MSKSFLCVEHRGGVPGSAQYQGLMRTYRVRVSASESLRELPRAHGGLLFFAAGACLGCAAAWGAAAWGAAVFSSLLFSFFSSSCTYAPYIGLSLVP